MMTKINKSFVNAEEKNDLYKAGYRYIVEGDYRTLDSTDPWSGMPNTTNNIYAFTDKAEAEAFAVTQIWVFNPDVHARVEELPEHTKTWTETREEEAKKATERKAKREANEAKKAAEAGMTVEEYKAEKKRVALAKKVAKEIAELEAELARKKALLKKLES
jgi:hypothetical protein